MVVHVGPLILPRPQEFHTVDLWRLIGGAVLTRPFPLGGLHLFCDEGCKLEICEVGHIVMPCFPVVDDVAAIFCVCAHRACASAFVVSAIDLLRSESEPSGQHRGWFEHGV